MNIVPEAAAKYKMLLSPLKVGPMEIRNRMVYPAVETNYASRDGFVTDHMIDYYVERAKGGAGLIIVEATSIRPGGELIINECGAWDGKFLKGLSTLARSVKAEGASVLLQLFHAGPRAIMDITHIEAVAPSSIPLRLDTPPRALTTEEVQGMVISFAEAARRAQEAGFDGVEFHCAHLYIISSFLSPAANQRTDQYGGSLENRARFILEILRETRKRVGKDFVISCRINAIENIPNGLKLEESLQVAKWLEEAGIDLLNVSAVNRIMPFKGNGYTFRMVYSILPKTSPEGAIVHYATEMKKIVKVPVATVGKIFNPDLAEEIVRDGKADLVGMARPIIADPWLPKKIMENRAEDIKKCTQ
ncbi:MAG: NADH:flavin oxidoreductase, partial [Dehalococcoidia bacterium]|nr:NADH:flavin oxidoreductase [Dehalococcoidia bacterium]